MKRALAILSAVCLAGAYVSAGEPVLSPSVRAVPGGTPTPFLRYQNPAATSSVQIAGQWNAWTAPTPLNRQGDIWVLDTRTLPGVRPGRVEYKFISDGGWEAGDNRVFFLNDGLELEIPPDVIASCSLAKRDEIVVQLKQPLPSGAKPAVRFDGGADNAPAIAEIRTDNSGTEAGRRGYRIAGNALTFLFEPAVYGQNPAADAGVTVAGNFNNWQASAKLVPQDGVWRLTLPLDSVRPLDGDTNLVFKFVVNGNWMQPPADAPNAQPDGKGNTNLRLDRHATGSSTLTIKLAAPLPFDRSHTLVLDGIADRRVRRQVDPGRALDEVVSTRPLGVTTDRTNALTTYRLFAPRATAVHLCFFDTPHFETHRPSYRRLPPAQRFAMCRNATDGTWALTTVGLGTGKYYAFTVDGPPGDGENFNGDVFLGDPYADAAAHAENCAIVMDRDATNRWFGGWTDQDWKAPRHEDMVIYEAHVRDLTMDPSSGVPAALRGTYEGLLASAGTKTGLDHLRALGVNMIEFLPTAEFGNGETNHNWGYCTAYYFAPEASYARDPLQGSQVYEFKRLVNELHRQGFGVIVDVVYNHVGYPNVFTMIDKKYYFRLGPDYAFQNFSGCGNDVRTEAPMMRRLIIDNMVHWAREYRVDGFRLDLAELIDFETLQQARAAVLKVNPNAILISEPWSFRGDHKQQLRGTGWSAWNNDFRYAIKDFVRGGADRNWIKKVVAGSTGIWTANPLQAVNYVESHDDMALVDELSSRPDRDGRHVTDVEARMNRLCAAVLFTSFGIPMITEGQEFLRSKHGIHNSFDRGDTINALRWGDREKPPSARNQSFYADMIKLRLSPEAASLRLREMPPGYLQWIEPHDGRLLGYIANAGHTKPGRAFVVLYNAANVDADFSVPLPAGDWKQVCDGFTVNPAGMAAFKGGGTTTIRVPFGTAVILRD